MTSIPSKYGSLPPAGYRALEEVLGRDDPSIIGVVLTGSAARGFATVHSDVDVVVVRDEDDSTRTVLQNSAIDEIPVTLADLEAVHPVGTEGAWFRWSYAWAEILRDTSGGRVTEAVRRQATLTNAEVHELLIGRSYLDAFINFSYRALKSHRDGRPEAARLDAAESVPTFLDILFALSGRVRPYNKYLAWELKEHPLPPEIWDSEALVQRVNDLFDGREAAVRESFCAVERLCRAYEKRTCQQGWSKMIDDWGDELKVLRGA